MPEIQYGICKNRGRCSIADSKRSVFMPADGRCPECAQPLSPDMSRSSLKILPLLVVLALVGFGGYYVYENYLKPKPSGPDPVTNVTPTPTGPVANVPTPTPAGSGGARAAKDKFEDRDFELRDENAKARKDVIDRIDRMPNLTTEQKNKLYSSVDRARGMGCILLIPFAGDKKTLDPKEAQILTNAIASPGIKKLTEDPTLVFVILGYADKKADPKVSEKTSIDRAESVLATMRDKAGVTNVMYGVGMGGADILNKDNKDSSNRLVEVWAVFP